jgi:hypothetical protein
MDNDELFDDRRFEEWGERSPLRKYHFKPKKIAKKRVLILLTYLKAKIKTQSY